VFGISVVCGGQTIAGLLPVAAAGPGVAGRGVCGSAFAGGTGVGAGMAGQGFASGVSPISSGPDEGRSQRFLF
jgi:hypothetical protein